MATTDISQTVFAQNTSYTLTKTLSHAYKNINFIKVCLSTFSSTTTNFGFDVYGNYYIDPATSVNITLNTIVNATFINIGFHVILICDGFNSIVSVVSWNITLYNTNVTVAAVVPANNTVASFF